MKKIMLVDDEVNILKSLGRLLSFQSDWEVETYDNATDALKRARSSIFDVIISDYNMPEYHGIDFLRDMRELQPDACRILLTGVADMETLTAAINTAGAFRFFTKPWDDDQLIQGIREGIHYRQIQVENRMLAEKLRDQEDELEEYRRMMRKTGS